MLVDAHAHYSGPAELPVRRGMRTLFCGDRPETAARVLALRSNAMPVSCGLHPWYADRHALREMLPFIRQSDALGEIGLDSVWCDVDPARQLDALRRQLALAQALRLPVVLHTKGMERKIADEIAGRPLRALVHWYSCMEHLDAYIALGCWFTVGPDHAVNPAVRQVIRRVPPDRLLTETDGLEAVAWALGRPVSPDELPGVLRGELRAIAAARHLTEEEAERLVERNFDAFLYGPPAQ